MRDSSSSGGVGSLGKMANAVIDEASITSPSESFISYHHETNKKLS
jgi:hypothetical protein